MGAWLEVLFLFFGWNQLRAARLMVVSCVVAVIFFFRFGLASEGGWLGQRADERGVRHVRGRRRPQGFSPGHTAREHHRNPDP